MLCCDIRKKTRDESHFVWDSFAAPMTWCWGFLTLQVHHIHSLFFPSLFELLTTEHCDNFISWEKQPINMYKYLYIHKYNLLYYHKSIYSTIWNTAYSVDTSAVYNQRECTLNREKVYVKRNIRWNLFWIANYSNECTCLSINIVISSR